MIKPFYQDSAVKCPRKIMKTKTIRVTKKDIEEATKLRDCASYRPSRHCPIAQALHRSKFPRAIVGFDTVSLYGIDSIRLPDSAEKFTSAFDSKQPVKPFAFKIEMK